MLEDTKRIFDSKSLFTYEENLFSLPVAVCAGKLPYHKMIPPPPEKYFTETHRCNLLGMCSKIYRAELIEHVSLRYEEFAEL